jgi:hypothetical protein
LWEEREEREEEGWKGLARLGAAGPDTVFDVIQQRAKRGGRRPKRGGVVDNAQASPGPLGRGAGAGDSIAHQTIGRSVDAASVSRSAGPQPSRLDRRSPGTDPAPALKSKRTSPSQGSL